MFTLSAMIEYCRLKIEYLWNTIDLKKQSIAIH
jgi:hypothetical protein